MITTQKNLTSSEITAVPNGPYVEARFDTGKLFVRAEFDYSFLSSAKFKVPSYTADRDGYSWWTEAAIGYKVFEKDNIGLAPYIGFGYFESKSKSESDSNRYLKFATPYAAVGGILSYATPQWSIGLDAALLLPFSGTTKDSYFPGVANKFNYNVGLGTKVQLPVTYTILPKKDNFAGIILFMTPYYEYMDTLKGKNRTTSAWGAIGTTRRTYGSAGNFTVSETFSIYGIKAGIGFVF